MASGTAMLTWAAREVTNEQREKNGAMDAGY
jgi:hypothetical protein